METSHQGYVIRIAPYKENDAILTFLTPQGMVVAKVRGFAKSESKLRNACQLYAFGEYSFAASLEQGHKTLIGANLLKAPVSALTSVEVSSLLSLFAEALIKIELEEDVNAFDTFHLFLTNLNLHPSYRSAYLVLLAHLLHWTGITLEVDQCVNCGAQKNIVAVSFNEGGFLCARCNKELLAAPVDNDYLKLFRYVMKSPIDKFHLFDASPQFTHRLATQLFEYLESMAGVVLKSKDVLAAIL